MFALNSLTLLLVNIAIILAYIELVSSNSNWLTFGIDYQRSGYVFDFNTKIDNNTKINFYDTLTWASDQGDSYLTSVAIFDNIVYYCEFDTKSGRESIVIGTYNLTSKLPIWQAEPIPSNDGNTLYNYCTSPSISNGGNYLTVLAGNMGGINGSIPEIYVISVDIETQDIKQSKSAEGNFWYQSDDTDSSMIWNIIPPAIDDNNEYIYFTSTYNNTQIFNSFTTIPPQFNLENSLTFDNNVISFQPSFYNDSVYVNNKYDILRINSLNNHCTKMNFPESSIKQSTSNVNTAIVISKFNNIVFVVGNDLCASSINSNNVQWCNQLKGGPNQSVTPSIDDENNIVFIYDNTTIYGYDQFNGTLLKQYSAANNGILFNKCTKQYGCISSQPIITKYNIIWPTGDGISIFDKETQEEVNIFTQVICGEVQNESLGNSIALYGKFFIVSCQRTIHFYTIE